MSYNPTDKVKPEEDRLVVAMRSDGKTQLMKFWRNLWWDKDKTMYVYFTPQSWRYIEYLRASKVDI